MDDEKIISYRLKIEELMSQFILDCEATNCANCARRYKDCINAENRKYNCAKGEFFGTFLEVLLRNFAYPAWEQYMKENSKELNEKQCRQKMFADPLKKVIELLIKEEPVHWK